MRYLLLLILLIPYDLVGQTVSGVVSSPTIGDQEPLAYTLEISGADASEITTPNPPEAEGLDLISSTASRASSVSITNGQVSRSVSYTWHYRPLAVGDARILAATVMIASQEYTAPPVLITVVDQAQRPPPPQRRSPFGRFGFFDDPVPASPPPEVTERDIFIRATQSSPEAYLNEQVTLDYQLYFRPETMPRNSRQADSWDAEGFWREELDLTEGASPQTVVENGLRYQIISIRRVAVFPARPGALAIDPLKIVAEVQSPDADPFRTPLFARSYSTVERSSAPITITSKPLPENAPSGFSGAVGQYSLTAELSRSELEVGEALQLTVTIEGIGNISLIEAPQPELPGIFEVYDPEVNTQKSERGPLIRGKKIFTWLLIPRSNGMFEIPPIRFVFFDPKQSRYIVRTQSLTPLTITGSAPRTIATAATTSGFPVDDIAAVMRDPRWSPAQPIPLHRHVWFYLILLLPLVGLGTTAILRKHRTRLVMDPAWARNRRAHPLARKHLKNAKKLLEEGSPDKFYAALEQAVLGFLGNRLNISERGLTRPQLAKLLAEAGLPADRQQELVQFLDTCDAARFAPVPPEYSQMEEHLMQASHILSSIADELETAMQ